MQQKFVPNKRNQNQVWIPIALIEDAVKLNYINSIAYLTLLKNMYKSNTFYNFSLRKVADKIQVSHSALSFHLKVLESKGLIRFHAGNLTIVATRKIAEKQKLTAITKQKTLSLQIISLKASLVIKNIQEQDLIIKAKREIKKTHEAEHSDYNYMKKIMKLQKKLGFKHENDFCDKTILSYTGFGRIINRSLSTGKRFQQKLKSLGYIQTRKNIELYSQAKFNRKGFFSLELPASFFLSNKGLIYKRNANEIILTHA